MGHGRAPNQSGSSMQRAHVHVNILVWRRTARRMRVLMILQDVEEQDSAGAFEFQHHAVARGLNGTGRSSDTAYTSHHV